MACLLEMLLGEAKKTKYWTNRLKKQCSNRQWYSKLFNYIYKDSNIYLVRKFKKYKLLIEYFATHGRNIM